MTRLEILTLLYSLESVLNDEDSKKAHERALKLIRKLIKEAESSSQRRVKTDTDS